MVLCSPDSATLADKQERLDHDIMSAFMTYDPVIDPSLARWLAKPLSDILSRSLDFKQQWLELSKVAMTHE
jgi:hypothetical protein